MKLRNYRQAGRIRMKKIWMVLMALLWGFFLQADELTVLNRSGFNILDIRVQKPQDLQPGENLIPYDVLMDQGFLVLDLQNEGEFTLVLQDEMGDIYLKKIDNLESTPKVLITLNDLRVMETQSSQLRVGISNQVEYPIIELYISPAHSESWGSDVLDGAPLRQGESVQVSVDASQNGTYDIKFTCDQNHQLKDYYLKSIELRDLGLFSLRLE